MRRNDLKELRSQSPDSLTIKLRELEKELISSSLKLERRDLKNLRTPKMLKRSIAQLNTLFTEAKLFAQTKGATK